MNDCTEAKTQNYKAYRKELKTLRSYSADEKSRISAMPDGEYYRKVEAITEYYRELDRLMLRVNNAWQLVERAILDEYRTIRAVRITHEINTKERLKT